MGLKISVSMTDFAPLFLGQEYLFKRLKATGIDGVELVIGVKSRWSVKQIKRLTQLYELPVISIHQPIWAGLGLYFDEDFFSIAKELGAQTVVCHPLPRISFGDKKMLRYLKRLAAVKQKTKLEILLENLPPTYGYDIVNAFFPINPDAGIVPRVAAIAQEYGLKITLDIDHLHVASPHKEPWFEAVLPSIGNIHLSSFAAKQYHLPLTQGDFHASEFIDFLTQKNYQGLLTLEIYYPHVVNHFGYDFDAIRESVEVIRDEKK